MFDRLPPTTFHRPMRAGEAFRASPPLLALLALASLPTAAPAAERNFSVSGFDRIRIDGPYKVSLKTNVAPFARATGTAASLDGVSVKVEGRTLVVREGTGAWGGYPGEGRGPVTIEIGTHDLSAIYVNGAGSLDVDRIKGLSFEVSIQGSGVARIDQVDVDQLKVGIAGAGTARLAGRAAKLTATVRGTSAFEGESLSIANAVIGAEGPSTIRAEVTNSAKIDASGPVSVALTGDAACTVRARGSADVTGCKDGSRF